jgi:predicted transposase YbfD/YdcC
MLAVIDYLSTIEDPRDQEKVEYPLTTLLFISICAIFCGAEGWEDIVLFTDTRKSWLSKYVDMSKGTPSYSTFRRLFSIVEPSSWSKLIEGTLGLVMKARQSEDQIAIDGKSLRGSRCASKELRAIQMVSAWSFSNKLVLADTSTDSKSNEIKAIPLLLELLNLEGCTISIDAIGCQSDILKMIVEKGGDFVIGLKRNQPSLYEAVIKYHQSHGETLENLIHDEYDNSHGRQVRRRYFSYEIPQEFVPSSLCGINSIIATETISSKNHEAKTSAEWRFYITSHNTDKSDLYSYVKNHWSIENELHWHLDVHLNDDADKKRDEVATVNFSRIKRMLLSLVKAKLPPGKKRSVRSRLKQVGWDTDYLISLLSA